MLQEEGLNQVFLLLNKQCNMNLIEVTSIPNKTNSFPVGSTLDISLLNENMLINHEERLKYLIYQHKIFTNSDLAKKVLSNWQTSIKKFKMVFPKDYKKALLNMQAENIKSKRRMKV